MLTIVTTINGWTDDLEEWRDQCDHLLVVCDEKTPDMEERDRSTIITLDRQKKEFPRLHAATPLNHYARKNLGYAWAIKQGASEIFETDDDNAPCPDFFADVGSPIGVFPNHEPINVFKLFYPNPPIYPRGWCRWLDTRGQTYSFDPMYGEDWHVMNYACYGDPDVDALTRIADQYYAPPYERTRPCFTITLHEEQWCPFNSQHTRWRKEAFEYMLLPDDCTMRETDIVRGWRLLERNEFRIGFTNRRFVWQNRNEHNLLADLDSERRLYDASVNVEECYSPELLAAWEDEVMS